MKRETTTFDVRIWPKIREYEGARGTTYQVRRSVAGKEINSPTFATYALADAFRSQLMDAQRRGEAFDIEKGIPVSMVRAAKKETTIYAAALAYVDHKWKPASATYRRDIAQNMTLIVISTLRAQPADIASGELRRALREWAFNTERRERAPDDVASVLRWVARNSRSVSDLEDSEALAGLVAALSRKVDGSQAAGKTRQGRRATLHNFAAYTVARNLIEANLVGAAEWATVKAVGAIDKRSLVNPEQEAAILAAVKRRKPSGDRVYVFARIMLRAGLRPEEVAALHVRDLTLPESGWGEITVSEPTPEVGKQWTDSGEVRDRRRQNKGREVGDVRYVPAPPDLVADVREHVQAHKLKPNDLLLTGTRNGDALAAVVVRRAWAAARLEVLGEEVTGKDGKPTRVVLTLTGKKIYDLRHTCLTRWLNKKIPPAQVAEWAGNSVPVLLATYAKCIDGQAEVYRKLLEDDTAESRATPSHQPHSGAPHRPRGARQTSPRISRSHPHKSR